MTMSVRVMGVILQNVSGVMLISNALKSHFVKVAHYLYYFSLVELVL